MKQLVQSATSGEVALIDMPAPSLPPGFVLVRTAASLVSAGTERSMTQFAEKNLLQKALARPDLVRQVLTKARRDGIGATIAAVRSRLDEPVQLGYSVAGTVIDVAEGVDEFRPGDRVTCAGAGFANHAELVAVPRNLCAPLPDSVKFEEGAFATVGAIALHGMRLGRPALGEWVAVIGLGLLGQLAAQLAKAAGCGVIGVELIEDRRRLARELGVDAAVAPEDAEQASLSLTAGRGADLVLITADTASNAPVELAGLIARDRARVVAVGAVGMEIPRRVFYAKELEFIVSRSYGPGRYDPEYEIEGRDYPPGFVRWTEGRNLAAFVEALGRGSVRVAPLITHRIPIDSGAGAYDVIHGRTGEPFLGVVLTYPRADEPAARSIRLPADRGAGITSETLNLGVIGSGAFARSVLIPALARVPRTHIRAVASRQGLSARTAAQQQHAEYFTTDEESVLGDKDVHAVVIATRHNLHARQVLAAADAGKHVFVEKPLCLTLDDLARIEERFGREGAPMLMVGFNRRFAPLARELAEFVAPVREPLVSVYRVNAGYLPPDHWVHDPAVGGGRIVGEGCHFIDFLAWLARDVPVSIRADAAPDGGHYHLDNVSITVRFRRGGVGTIVYVASGGPALGKERVEVHGGGRSAVLEDFRRLELFSGKTKVIRAAQDKGHRAECSAFIESVREGRPAIPLADLVAVSRTAILAAESAADGRPRDVIA